jgi:hypothetical protein
VTDFYTRDWFSLVPERWMGANAIDVAEDYSYRKGKKKLNRFVKP